MDLHSTRNADDVTLVSNNVYFKIITYPSCSLWIDPVHRFAHISNLNKIKKVSDCSGVGGKERENWGIFKGLYRTSVENRYCFTKH